MRNQRVRTGKPTGNRRLRATQSHAATPGEGTRIRSGMLRHERGQLTSPPELEVVIDKDRAFFRARPWRTARMRPTERPEMDALARAGGALDPLMPGHLWITVVRQMVPGYRHRVFCQLPVGRDLDPSDAVCLDLHRYLTGQPDTVIGRIEAERRGRVH